MAKIIKFGTIYENDTGNLTLKNFHVDKEEMCECSDATVILLLLRQRIEQLFVNEFTKMIHNHVKEISEETLAQ